MSSNSPSNKPTWLQILEAESWQAELLISGAAILGSFQLPELINDLIDIMVFQVPDELAILAYFTFFYLFVAAATLIMSFLFHFGMRAVWIGMIGLASVYPEGIKPVKRLSKRTMERLLADFGDIGAYNQQLDRRCSVIFASAFNLVMIFLSITFLLVVCYIIGYLMLEFVPQVSLWNLMYGALAFFIIPTILISLMNLKSIREKEWVQEWQYPISQIYSKIFFSVFYRPISYIINIFTTNSGTAKSILSGYASLAIAMIIAIQFMNASNIFMLFPGKFENIGKRTDRIYSYNYANQIAQDEVYINPILDSDILTDTSHLRLFLPLLNREKKVMKEQCGAFSGEEDKEAERAYWLNCYRNSYQIKINDKQLSSYVVKYHNHPHGNEPGLLFYISQPPIIMGENLLVIEHTYKDEEGNPKLDRIPFYYFGGE